MSGYRYVKPGYVFPALLVVVNILTVLGLNRIVSRISGVLIPNINMVVLYIVLNTVLLLLSTYLLRSYILGIVNALIVLFLHGQLLVEYFLISFIIYMLVSRRIGIDDILFTLKDVGVIKPKGITLSQILHSLALLFAGVAIILPLSGYLTGKLFGEELWVYFPAYFMINMIISFLIILLSSSPEKVFASGLLSAFHIYSMPVLIYYSIEALTSYTIPGMDKLLMDMSGKIYLGRIKALLVHGKPRNIYRLSHNKGIQRGKTWYWMKTHGLLTIDLDKLPNKHIVIVGASGMGKSIMAKHIVIELLRNYNDYKIVILDPHGEYGDILKYIPDINIIDASKISINPLELGGRDPRERAHELSYTIQSLFRLGHLQRQILEELIVETYKSKGIYSEKPETWSRESPTFDDLVKLANMMSREDEYVKRITPYLKILSNSVFSSTSLEFRTIFDKPTVILLNTLSSDYVRSLYMESFLYKVMNHIYTRRVNGKVLIVIDEAHNIFKYSAGRRIISKTLMESRKYGLGTILITQQPLLIPQPVYQNSSLRICFNTSEPKNNSYLSKLLAGEPDRDKIREISNALSKLGRFEYVLSIIGKEQLFITDMKPIVEAMNKPVDKHV